MKYKVIEQWNFNEVKVLLLDRVKTVTSARDDYRYCQIGGVVYKPVPMLHGNGKCVAVKAEGDFVGKEVEFIKGDT